MSDTNGDGTEPKTPDGPSAGTKGLSPDSYANGGVDADIEFKS